MGELGYTSLSVLYKLPGARPEAESVLWICGHEEDEGHRWAGCGLAFAGSRVGMQGTAWPG